ncbi:MAG: polysaccharide deacetylase family protein [Candidatus Curtissbacteria bacterium]|nr:polysaccharide deacetylase family protein [Candidatus Curtissbacteria bacterium]
MVYGNLNPLKMKIQNLSTQNMIKGQIGSLLNRWLFRGSKNVKRVTIKVEGGRKVFIKQHTFKFKDMDYYYLVNEANVIKTLNKAKHTIKDRVHFPKFVDFVEEENKVTLKTEYEGGRKLSELTSKQRLEILEECLHSIWTTSAKLRDKKLSYVAKRTNNSFFAFLPYYIVRAFSKDLKNYSTYFGLIFKFYKYYLASYFINNIPTLTHRDLDPDNIKISRNGEISIYDWENAVMSDKLFDLASICEIYSNEIKNDHLSRMLRNTLETKSEIDRLLALSIFSSTQKLALYPKRSKSYKNAKINLANLETIKNNLTRDKRTLFEIVNSLTLNILSFTYQKISPEKIKSSKKTVLCYHSISNSSWRYSMRKTDFARQIEFLRKNYNLVSLPTLLDKRTKRGIAITFDDGYADVYENALPVLKAYKVPATIFVLGDREHPNRKELDNNEKLMTISQIKELHAKGWEVGFHTKTHSKLGDLSDHELKAEIIDGKRELENKLGFTMKYFAYPFGIYSREIINAVKSARFEAAFTVDGSEIKHGNNLLISRVPTEGDLSVNQFAALISPIGLIINQIFMSTLKTKAKTTKKISCIISSDRWKLHQASEARADIITDLKTQFKKEKN